MSSQFNPVVGIERSIPRGAAHQAVGLLQVPFRCAVVLVRVEVEFALRCFCRWCDILVLAKLGVAGCRHWPSRIAPRWTIRGFPPAHPTSRQIRPMHYLMLSGEIGRA